MESESDPEARQRLKAAVEESQASAKELTKDAALLARQAAILKARAAQTRAKSQETRAQARQVRNDAGDILLSIPEAAHTLHVAERTLRHLLQEPALQACLIERTCKVGIYHKFIPLLPPELMAELTTRLSAKKPHDP